MKILDFRRLTQNQYGNLRNLRVITEESLREYSVLFEYEHEVIHSCWVSYLTTFVLTC